MRRRRNSKFKEFLHFDPNVARFYNKMFFLVYDGNQKLHAWMSYINKVHLDEELWHVVVDFIVLDMKKRIAGLLIAMENY
jgi:hypothetical protein